MPFAGAWSSASVGGNVYGQPLVYGGLVVVGTEADGVYALSESTGQVMWHVSVGTAVPAGQLPCGNISPTVGITSTPVIDPVTGRVFVAADTWDGSNASSIQHKLFALNLTDGSVVSGFPVAVDPPGTDHTALLQRTALALAGGKVLVGYGGNDGDCGTYHGWLVAVPESGGSVQSTFEVEPSATGGAIWGSGDGAAVDSSGNVWVATGNGFGSGYGNQESVLKLDSSLNLLDHWAPSNWQFLDDNDIDLGSTDPLLLPGGLVFQIGKQGVGYLLSASSLGGTGANPVYSAQVCGQTSDASFGGAIYYQGIIYVSCSDGLRALTLNTSTQTFSAVSGWQVHFAALGPPIEAGGLIWVAGWNSQQLFGLNPQTGQITVDQTGLPTMMHFTTPSASDGKLFLATGQTIQAYTIANSAISPPAISETFSPSSIPLQGNSSLTLNVKNSNSGTTLNGVAVTDSLPNGLVIAAASNLANSCGGTATAAAGSNAVSLSEGTINPASTCSISVTVTGTAAGTATNTTGAVTSSNGGTGNTASASLTIQNAAGNWTGSYGSAGYVLAGWNGSSDVAALPAGVTESVQQGSRWTWVWTTSDGRALQTPDGQSRELATYYDPSQIKLQLSFASAYSGNLHLYALDPDRLGRRESITVDDGSGPRTVHITTDFSQGAWLRFPISVPNNGTVAITVNNDAGANAVLEGITLGDGGPTTMPAYETPPQGNWTAAYGSAGYVLAGWNGSSDLSALPGGVGETLQQGSRWVWSSSSGDPRALKSPDGSTRKFTTYYDPAQIKVQLSFPNAYSGNLHLYALDADRLGRRESITVDDGSGARTVRITTDFSQGAWLSFPISVSANGTVSITVNNDTGANAVLEGIMLGDGGPA